MRRARGFGIAAAATLAGALALAGAGCAKGPPANDPVPGWPTRPDPILPKHVAPTSVALVSPGARSATAWLEDGTLWNGDVELAFFDGEGGRLAFDRRFNIISGEPMYFGFGTLGKASTRTLAFSPWRSEREDTAGWAWVAIEVRGAQGAATQVHLQAAMRSGGGEGRYVDPRAAHADSFSYGRDGVRVLRDGRLIAMFDARAGAQDEPTGAPGAKLPYDRYTERRDYVLDIPAGGRASLRFALAPLGGADAKATPPGWSDPAKKVFDRTRDMWRKELAKGARYTFPDELWNRAFEAARGLLVTDYERHGSSRAPLGNPLQYRDFYLRDGARVVRALDLLDRPELATDALDLLYEFQWPPGAFLSQRGQLDGTGQALWALAQHVALTNDEATLRRHGDAALKGARWITAMRQATRQFGGPATGLMPFSDPRDNELIRGHLLGTDAWSVCGLDAAADLARRLGRDGEPLRAEAAAYRRDLIAVWDREIARQGRPLPPAIEHGARDWGNLSAAYPCGVLDAADGRMRALDAWLHDRMYSEGLMTFGSRDSIHHYVSFDVTQARLRRGDRAGALEDIAAYLEHTLPDGTGFEFRSRSSHGYGDNLPPHGTFAAMWIDLARAAVLYESGDSLVLFAGAANDWFDPTNARNGAGALVVERAPTRFGPASMRMGPKPGDAADELEVDLPAPARATLPVGVRAEAIGAATGGRFEGSTLLLPKGKTKWRLRRATAG